MAAERDRALLVAELRALATAIPTPDPDTTVTDAVMAALEGAAAPAPAPWHSRLGGAPARLLRGVRRKVVAAAIALVLALVAVPPVRAAVAEWFGVGGVKVRLEPGSTPTASPSPPPAVAGGGTLRQAADAVAFPVRAPSVLGPPDGVQVSADRRVVSMSWTTAEAGVLRLDQFGGDLDYAFAKTAPGAEFTSVGGDFALFFDSPHEVVVLDPDGTPRTASARLAGHTLIWTATGWTARLEGQLSRERAVEIAESVVVVPAGTASPSGGVSEPPRP